MIEENISTYWWTNVTF